MYLNHFTTEDELDTVLRDGIPMSDRSTGAARKPNVTWLTENSIPSVPSIGDRKFIADLQPYLTRWPPNYAASGPDANFEGVIRVRVRIRWKQATWWLPGAVADFDTKRSNDFAIYNFDDGWRVLRQAITPNQITRVDEWSVDDNEWRKLRLVRRLVRPAVIRLKSLLKSRIASRFASRFRGDHHPVA